MNDYYLTAYESVFDFFDKISVSKLKINPDEYLSLLENKNKEYFKDILDLEIHDTNNNTQILEELNDCFYDDIKNNLKKCSEKWGIEIINDYIEKCSIDEISKYLIKQGNNKDFPDITKK